MQKSDQINELATALAKAQGEFQNITKGADNPYFKSKYADLASVVASVRPILAKHGLSFTQSVKTEGLVLTLGTLILHTSGQFLQGSVSACPKDPSPQAVGSAVTYLRRYGIMAMLGVAAEDDDGEGAQQREGGAPPGDVYRGSPRDIDWLRDQFKQASGSLTNDQKNEIARHMVGKPRTPVALEAVIKDLMHDQ